VAEGIPALRGPTRTGTVSLRLRSSRMKPVPQIDLAPLGTEMRQLLDETSARLEPEKLFLAHGLNSDAPQSRSDFLERAIRVLTNHPAPGQSQERH
jgi:hypothetical protein